MVETAESRAYLGLDGTREKLNLIRRRIVGLTNRQADFKVMAWGAEAGRPGEGERGHAPSGGYMPDISGLIRDIEDGLLVLENITVGSIERLEG